jgi:spermidine synthase
MRKLWITLVLFVLVFASGFANLATEIIGPRMVSSFFGSSTSVWAVMIAVTLVGLSVGYFLGGRVPFARIRTVMPAVLVINSVYLALVSSAIWSIPPDAGNLGLIGILFFCALAFFIPSALFGMLSPMAITILSTQYSARAIGRVVGAIYAIGTLGSVTGALTAAFYLIPYVGLSGSLQLFCIGLTLFAALFYLLLSSAALRDAREPVAGTAPRVHGGAITLRRDEIYIVLFFVLVSGFISLATEIIAPRLFTSMFGPTTILWAIMIAVTLVGLSIGYSLGGWVPTRHAKVALAVVLIVNAVLIVCASWLVWELPEQLGALNVGAVTLLAVIAFLLPSILFGMDSQIAIRILVGLEADEKIARIVGGVYAISNIGAVAGAISAAVLLIPALGSSTTLHVFAVIFAAFAAYFARGMFRPILLVCALVLIVFPQPDWRWQTADNTELLAQREGYYQTIRVYTDNRNFIRFHLGPTYESEMDINSFEPRFGYAQAMVSLVTQPQGARVLMIGGAGHSIARALEARGAIVTEVEIDPVVVQVSDALFGRIDGDVVIQDGRAYVEQAPDAAFDYVLVDAFDGPASVPAQLTTREFFDSVRRILQPEGRLIMNFIGAVSGERSNSFRAMSTTIASAFADARYTGGGNIIFVASAAPMPDIGFDSNVTDGTILTDNLNPIEIYLEEARSNTFAFRR